MDNSKKGKAIGPYRKTPLKQIRKLCRCCCHEHRASIRLCCTTECPVWYFRFGMSPKRTIKQRGMEYQELFRPENFDRGGKFGPEKQPEIYGKWKSLC